MPYYVYVCQKCHASVRQFRMSVDRNEARDHDDCGGEMERAEAAATPTILVPSHFQKHTHTTGLASEIGGHPDVLPKRRWNNPFGV
jgi:hypothetical protein